MGIFCKGLASYFRSHQYLQWNNTYNISLTQFLKIFYMSVYLNYFTPTNFNWSLYDAAYIAILLYIIILVTPSGTLFSSCDSLNPPNSVILVYITLLGYIIFHDLNIFSNGNWCRPKINIFILQLFSPL